MTGTEALAIQIVLFIAVPAAVGIYLSGWAGNFAKRKGSSPLVVRTLRVVISVVWIAIVIAETASILGTFSFLSALTVSAVAGIAITLALQTTLQNILSGFILIRGRFLHIGDTVQFSGVKGTVVSIGLVEVVVRTDTGALALMSNSNLLSGPLINFTAAQRLAGEY